MCASKEQRERERERRSERGCVMTPQIVFFSSVSVCVCASNGALVYARVCVVDMWVCDEGCEQSWALVILNICKMKKGLFFACFINSI